MQHTTAYEMAGDGRRSATVIECWLEELAADQGLDGRLGDQHVHAMFDALHRDLEVRVVLPRKDPQPLSAPPPLRSLLLCLRGSGGHRSEDDGAIARLEAPATAR